MKYLMKHTVIVVTLLLTGVSAAWAECPDGKSEVILMTPSGITKTICVSDNAIPGIENAAEHTGTLTVPPVECRNLKPIDALILVYAAQQAGSRTIEDVSWYRDKFDPLDPTRNLINTIGPVVDGQEVNFDGFAGAYANDVDFFIQFTDGSTATSRFHLSCSDDEMNDITDCGAYQGNGKSNDSGLNTWLLKDLAGNGNVLGCP